MKPLLLLTIDVEEDMPGWRITDPISVGNVQALPRMADMCAKIGVPPTYLCNYPTVTEKSSVEILREVQARAACEIGTHIHPWNTPPFNGIPGSDVDERTVPYYQSVLGAERFRAKLEMLHAAVGEVRGSAPTAFRAGRFGIDATTLRELLPLGYTVDSSITPLENHGDNNQDDGPDFRSAPQFPYFPSADDVLKRGDLDIVEIPVSVGLTRRVPRFLSLAFVHLPRKTRLRGLLSRDFLGLVDFAWLYPARFDLELMQKLCRTLVAQDSPVLNIFLHSNELSTGTSGRIGSNDVKSVEADLCIERTRELLQFCIDEFGAEPVTLTEAARRLRPGLNGS